MSCMRALPLVAAALVANPAWAQPAPRSAASNPPAAQAAPDREADCAQRWQAYRRSQACYERFRTVSGGLRPGAQAQCGPALPDPSAQCGAQTLPLR